MLCLIYLWPRKWKFKKMCGVAISAVWSPKVYQKCNNKQPSENSLHGRASEQNLRVT